MPVRTRAIEGLALIGCLLFGATRSMAQDMSALQGTWQVVGVEVSSNGVQALTHNDPEYMRHRLMLDADRLAWLKPTTSGGTFGDVCFQPQLRSVAMPDGPVDGRIEALPSRPVEAFAVTCGRGSWGPGGGDVPRIYRLAGGGLALDWYDGGLLLLRKP